MKKICLPTMIALLFLFTFSFHSWALDKQEPAQYPLQEQWRPPLWDDHFMHFQHRMHRLMDQFFSDVDAPTEQPFSSSRASYSPDIDIHEKENLLILTAEVPGLDKNNIEITLQDNVLALKGEKKIEEEVKKENYFRRQRSYGSFYRAIRLPVNVKEEEITAKLKNGVLTITLVKEEGAVPEKKVIPIK